MLATQSSALLRPSAASLRRKGSGSRSGTGRRTFGMPGSGARCAVGAAAGAKPALLINSCTGKMGQAVGEAALRAGLEVLPYTFSSAADASRNATVDVGGVAVATVPPGPDRVTLVRSLQKSHPGFITVDYTVPDVIHQQVDFYVEHGMPFVMGTTGGDRNAINRQVEDAKLYAVIAPNMGKQIVAFQVWTTLRCGQTWLTCMRRLSWGCSVPVVGASAMQTGDVCLQHKGGTGLHSSPVHVTVHGLMQRTMHATTQAPMQRPCAPKHVVSMHVRLHRASVYMHTHAVLQLAL
eukprot:365362-Chlamydomonas_euryale.AAC.21